MTTLETLRKHERVEIVDDERESGDGIFVTLKAGWSFDPFQDNRVGSADTISDALALVRGALKFTGTLTD